MDESFINVFFKIYLPILVLTFGYYFSFKFSKININGGLLFNFLINLIFIILNIFALYCLLPAYDLGVVIVSCLVGIGCSIIINNISFFCFLRLRSIIAYLFLDELIMFVAMFIINHLFSSII